MIRLVVLFSMLVITACGQQPVEKQLHSKPSSRVQSTVNPSTGETVSSKQSGMRVKPYAGKANLAGWSKGPNRSSIERFVKASINPNSSAFVPLEQRVAVFDLDGTLWVEKPQKAMVSFVKQELVRQAKQNPALVNQQPWQSAVRADDRYLSQLNFSTSYLSLLKAHAGLAQAVYQYKVAEFFEHCLHPVFKKPQQNLAYQPMQSLIKFLQAHDYRVYIVDGSENAFIRHFSQAVFNVPPENVIGSSALLLWRKGSEKLVRHHEFVAPVSDRDGKPVNIERHIAVRPVIAVGNDDSDLAMLNYVSERKAGSLVMILKHDDGDREYVYSAPGLEKTAKQKAWLSISMQKDFEQLFD